MSHILQNVWAESDHSGCQGDSFLLKGAGAARRRIRDLVGSSACKMCLLVSSSPRSALELSEFSSCTTSAPSPVIFMLRLITTLCGFWEVCTGYNRCAKVPLVGVTRVSLHLS